MPPSHRLPRPAVAVGIVLALALTGCTGDPSDSGDSEALGHASARSSPAERTPYAAAISDPVEDSLYPERGDDRIDTLHHDLDLSWDPQRRRLTGRQRITFRGARRADRFVLDLGAGLRVTSAELDGERVGTAHDGDRLIVDAPVRPDRTAVLELRYRGLASAPKAPSDRADTTRLGLRATADGRAQTMQEPYGAFTWYAVNDQPADKALYDVRLSVPAPWVGVSNGRLVSRETSRGRTVTEFRLGEPAASYLMTLAFGPYVRTDGDTVNGTRLTYWTPRDQPGLVGRLRKAERGLAWLEQRLGAYPFDTLGFIVIPGDSGMETQTMITLGDATGYNTSPPTLVHEMAHQWWGDEVGPCDWRDVWMNEGMATYLQILWEARAQHVPAGQWVASWAASDDHWRQRYGPPGDYHGDTFAAPNVYNPPAAMWHALRGRLGDELFWRLVRQWPRTHAGGCATREELIAWWSKRSGRDLEPFFTRWLMGRTDPH